MSKGAITIVDDEPGIIEIVGVNLAADGYDISSAGTGKDALRMIRAGMPDLVILDVMLPDMDGWEVLQALESSPETAGIPVIMLTARAADDDILRGLELGAVEYVTKPFFVEDLAASVKIIFGVFDPSLREDYRRQRIAKRRRLMASQGKD
jgi:DNA-binding response OmpR family regulator